MSEQGIDAVDDGFRARALPLEREYQRVSISGEEKCGVRQLSCKSFPVQITQYLMCFVRPTQTGKSGVGLTTCALKINSLIFI